MRIRLTARQIALLRPYFDRVKASAVLGNPGMLVAQIGHDDDGEYALTPAFLEHELAKQITQRGRHLEKVSQVRPIFNHERDCGLTNDVGTCECPQVAK